MGVLYKRRKTEHKEAYDKDMYETPGYVYDMILEELDPKETVIWEPFLRTGYSTKYMRSRGFEVINGEEGGLFAQNEIPRIKASQKTLVVVTTPSFSVRRKVVTKLHELGVTRMAVFVPIGMLTTMYGKTLFPAQSTQLVYHTAACHFLDPLTLMPRGKTGFDLVWITKGLSLQQGVQFKGK